ncbi:MAG: hypothetical protein OSJ70_07000 [Bacilli bacterium]|nr:hypothetical protein [Bacilli bacterium]
MNENLVEEIQKKIEELKQEILNKQEELDKLIDKYQEVCDVEIYPEEESTEEKEQ